MASSSTNSSIKSDDQNNKSNQSSQTSDGSKEVLAASTIVEESVKQQRVGFIGHSRREQDYNLSPHLIHKQAFASLTTCPITTTTTVDDSVSITRTRLVNQARPFEEVLVGQPTSDVLTKPGDGGS